jgi:hypothetical protein
MTAHPPRRAVLLSIIPVAGLLWSALVPAGSAAPTAPQGGAPDKTCFVMSLYRDLLGRGPNATELSNGLSFLISNGRDVYASSLLAGDGYRTVLIQGFYQKLLGRPATGVEVATWISFLNGVGTDEQVISIIAGSGEYFNQARVGASNTNFIQDIFHDLLGRSASGPEQTAWLNFLSTHTRQEMTQAILNSFEYQTDIIQAWYHRFLRRDATDGDVTAARAVLNSPSGTDEQVIAILLGSTEYFNGAGRCATYLPLVRR